ncbi:SMI1/KNR4 family protein [Mucilaginibacter rigui]|uniref:SMI1/KNR4 family protein n=1 Tax=Mucilaginibacter rigui TaxID=534635 RepID=A0ABR7X993_9SPHI|nr:SMI1/KNR4 family protein [Mucilaginibacter rigui]MBD1387099.1 SMI1/KNR4 family protein [Mucilaginibacter rigui]
MSQIRHKRTFLDLFENSRPVLKVKFDTNSTAESTEVEIENKLEKNIDAKELRNLEKLCINPNLKEFFNFYTKCNGFTLGTPVLPENAQKRPLLSQLPANYLIKFTELYLPKGKLAWTIDLNKTKTLYRGENKWLAFAQVDDGPACLTIFLEGEYAGNIFLVNPQPHFNTLKPIAKTFDDFLDRVAKDPAAFFKLTRAYVTIVERNDQNFGYVPVEYIDNGGILFPEKGEKISLENIRTERDKVEEYNEKRNKWWRFWKN